jgi:hypothetical protein
MLLVFRTSLSFSQGALHAVNGRRCSPRPQRRRGLAILLGTAFALAMVMGPGPGLYLVNPDPADPQATYAIAGVPILYLWAVFWFGVQAGVVLIAYFTLWNNRRSSL